MGTFPQWLAVGNSGYIAAAVAWRIVVASSEVGGILPHLVFLLKQMYLVVRCVALLTTTATGLYTQYDVTAPCIQPSKELQHRPEVTVLAVGQAGLFVVVHCLVEAVHRANAID